MVSNYQNIIAAVTLRDTLVEQAEETQSDPWCSMVLLEAVVLPSPSQSHQPGNWVKAEPATGDLNMEMLPHGIRQLWSKPIKNVRLEEK